jgi:hypothetical protein
VERWRRESRKAEGGDLGGELLDSVFAEESLAGGDGFKNGFGRVGFAISLWMRDKLFAMEASGNDIPTSVRGSGID